MIASLKRFLTNRAIIIGSLILTILFYGVIIQYEFVWDDFLLIVNNPTIHKKISISDVFSTGLWHSSLLGNYANSYYRPIVSLSYLIQYKLFGLSAAGFHMVSLAIHCMNLFFLGLIMIRLNLKPWALILALMLFSFHPVQVSAVSFISCQGDILALFFTLVSIRVWMEDHPRRYLALLSTTLALLCKESAVLLPFVLIFYDLLVKKAGWKKFFVWSPSLILMPYFFIRKVVLNDGAMPSISIEGLLQSPGGFRMLKFFGRLLFPSPTMPEYPIHSLLVWKSLSALILLFCVLFILWTKVLKSEKSRWLFVWFLFGLIPVADLSGMGLRFSDQLIYIASAPFAILVGQVVDKYSLKIKMMTAILLLVFICLAQQQLKIWRNSETLWSYALSLEPNNIMANINYASGLAQIGKEKESCDHSYKTLVLTLKNPVAIDQQLLVYNLGVCFENTHPAVAEKYYRAAVDISSGQHWASLHNLGLLLYKRGELNEAHEISTKLVKNFPGVYYSWKLMGLVQQGKGLSKQSSESFQKALSLNSADPDLIRLTQSIK